MRGNNSEGQQRGGATARRIDSERQPEREGARGSNRVEGSRQRAGGKGGLLSSTAGCGRGPGKH
eukprot:6101806-Pleurochrysis_carterae.AAC.1